LDQILSPGWATYLRVSDGDKQTPERSFAMQRQRIQENLLGSSELPFMREYRDMLTGTTPNRVDYQHMLADAEAGRFSHLGLYRADRFGRNTVEGLQAATKLIGLGIKIRVAHMPSLRPEEPDGFFMFLIQMGMAQREVDVMRQRARDGIEVVLRSGGWPNVAPAGYLNKERQIKSGKYERWVEKDPEYSQVLREAWDLLLTGRYTLDQICEELNQLGYTRLSGKPWAWTNAKRNVRQTAKSQLQFIFHNPFYAGWVVSGKFGIALSEIRGRWEPIVTTEEFNHGIEILNKHDNEKSRPKRQFYLLRSLLYVRVDNRIYRMYGSTPSGRSQSYAYYITHAKPNGKKLHIPCDVVDKQIPSWLRGITVNPELVPQIRKVYEAQLNQVTQDERETKVDELNHSLSRLREEETHLGRLLITGKMSEEVYDQLRSEWIEKIHHAETSLEELERNTGYHLSDLDAALALMTKLAILYARLEKKEQAILLQIIAKRIIVNRLGEIIDYDLDSPFRYLESIARDFRDIDNAERGSEQVLYRPPG
jgi:DNA invertase Pin-like site-specific DNA recombinase